MTALDKLRAIEKRIADGPDIDEAWQERNALSHYLLPAMEALDSQVKLFNSEAPNDGAVAAGMSYIAESILAQLEEALK